MTRPELTKWRRRVEAANARAPKKFSRFAERPTHFTYADVVASEGWRTCAVGEMQHKFPKVVLIEHDEWDTSEPDDRRLRRLGVWFHDAVNRDDVLRAFELLDLIEARVLELEAIKEIA